MSDEIRAQLKSLNERRMSLLRDLSKLDHEIQSCKAKLSPPPIKTSREFVCHCHLRFDWWLSLLDHILENSGDPLHYDDGEIIDGKHIVRNTTIVGNPISRKQAASKFDANTVDVDDLA
jgi:hypothetical protein